MSEHLFFFPILAQAPDPAAVAVTAGFLFLVFGLAILASLVFSGIFIHLSAKLLGFAQTFGVAVKAVLWQILFGIVFSFLFVLLSLVVPVAIAGAPMLSSWLGATFGIRQAYNVDFFKALVAAILSAILTFVGVVCMVLVLLLATGVSLRQMQQEIEKKAQPTISAEA